MEAPSPAVQRELKPLKYHNDLAEYLKQEEPQVWDWATSATVRLQQSEEMREAMLRQTYRLEAASHPAVFEACAKAMERLEIEAPATLYQAADGAMNASLYYIPGEVHLVFSGPTFERLTDEELLALLGHELAHYLFYTTEGGDHEVTTRIAYAIAKAFQREGARIILTYQAERQQKTVEDLLGKVVGAGKVKVAVSADLDFSSVSEQQTILDQDGSTVRNTQRTNDNAEGVRPGAPAPAGAISNTPGEQPSVAQGANAIKNNTSHSNEIINYEIPKTVRTTSRPVGQVKKLSVAVVLDNKQIKTTN